MSEGRFKLLRPRACDACRKRKIRCDGLETKGKNCSHCESIGAACTFISMSKRRAPTKAYTESLEMRLELMQRLLEKYATHAELEKELGFTLEQSEQGLNRPQSTDMLVIGLNDLPRHRVPQDIVDIVELAQDEPFQDDSESPFYDVTETEKLAVQMTDLDPSRYHGESSAVKFLRVVQAMRKDYDIEQNLKFRTAVPWANEAWFQSVFEVSPTDRKLKNFPDEDLMYLLVDLYFEKVHTFLPMLHQPTFMAQFRARRYLDDVHFGHLLLSMLALASTFSTDERVYVDVNGVQTPGYGFFRQVKDWNRSLGAANLTDIQAALFLAMYRWIRGQMHESWICVGISIRFAQDVGAHRQVKFKMEKDPIIAEQWKRIFWAHVIFDRFISSSLGHPLIVHEEDIDLEYPAEYESGEDPQDAAIVRYLRWTLKLGSLLSVALRTIYSAKNMLGRAFGPDAETKIVEQLDKGLDRWLRSLPNDCRWDPKSKDLIKLGRSAGLMGEYYFTVIMIHRPLIGRKTNAETYHGLDVCTKAARAAIGIASVLLARLPDVPPHLVYITWASGIVLLTKLWCNFRMEDKQDLEELFQDLRDCLAVLHKVSKPWDKTEQMINIIFDLAERGGIPLSPPETSTRLKTLAIEDPTNYDPSASSPSPPSTSSTMSSPCVSSQPKPSRRTKAPGSQSPPDASRASTGTGSVSPTSAPFDIIMDDMDYSGFVDPSGAQSGAANVGGANPFGDNPFGTWFQAPEGQGLDAWSSYLANVDIYSNPNGMAGTLESDPVPINAGGLNWSTFGQFTPTGLNMPGGTGMTPTEFPGMSGMSWPSMATPNPPSYTPYPQGMAPESMPLQH